MRVQRKAGILYVVSADGQQRKRVDGIPAAYTEGQAGLMDVVLHPGFTKNRLVYFSYAEAGQGGKGGVLARGVFAEGDQPALQKVETLFRATPYVDGDGHFSGRIAFAKDGHLFFTNGERQKFDPAQDPKATLGKVLRLNDDGTPARGNPLVAKGFHPAVWSYGHRNLLGLAFDASGNLWEQEMGPKGGEALSAVEGRSVHRRPLQPGAHSRRRGRHQRAEGRSVADGRAHPRAGGGAGRRNLAARGRTPRGQRSAPEADAARTRLTLSVVQTRILSTASTRPTFAGILDFTGFAW
jgi:Glucose / Sorbosone dehydrogenase